MQHFSICFPAVKIHEKLDTVQRQWENPSIFLLIQIMQYRVVAVSKGMQAAELCPTKSSRS